MALSDERIEQITGASRTRASMWLATTAIARAIEAEVRKDDEALIRQMLEALQRCTKYDDADYEAVNAARTRLKS